VKSDKHEVVHITIQVAADAAIGQVLEDQHLQTPFLAVTDEGDDVPVPDL
jgi:hypothetical protein